MDDEKEEEPTNFEILTSCLASLFVIVSLLYCTMIFEVPGRGCLWDKLASYGQHTAEPAELALNAPSKAITDWKDALNHSPTAVGKIAPVKPGETPVSNRYHRFSVCNERSHAFEQ